MLSSMASQTSVALPAPAVDLAVDRLGPRREAKSEAMRIKEKMQSWRLTTCWSKQLAAASRNKVRAARSAGSWDLRPGPLRRRRVLTKKSSWAPRRWRLEAVRSRVSTVARYRRDHIGCAINLHSIMNSGLIPGGQSLSKRQTVFFTSVDPMNKEHQDPEENNLNAPRLAWYKQKVWKKHQNTVCWVDIKLAQKKGFKFYQTRSNAFILYDTLPAYCIPKAIMMRSEEVKNEKVYASPPPPPKISFKDDGMKELGSEVAGGGKDSQQTQPKTKNPIVSSGRPVLSDQQSVRFECSGNRKCFLFGCESTNERTG